MVADFDYYTGKDLMVEVARAWGIAYETVSLVVFGTERVVAPELTLHELSITQDTVLQLVHISGDDEPSDRPQTLGSFLFLLLVEIEPVGQPTIEGILERRYKGILGGILEEILSIHLGLHPHRSVMGPPGSPQYS